MLASRRANSSSPGSGTALTAAKVGQGDAPGKTVHSILLEPGAGSREELHHLPPRPSAPACQRLGPMAFYKMEGSIVERFHTLRGLAI